MPRLEAALNDAAAIRHGESERTAQAESGDRPWRIRADLATSPVPANLRAGSHDSLEIELPDGTVHRGVFAVRCFPATMPDDFISLRTWDREGKERELGIVRHLTQWSAASQELMRSALGRRYFLRRITAIEEIKLEYGHLLFRVQTDQGPAEFTMRWNQSHAQDFGARGKVLLDLEDNRFLVPDVDMLSARERELFQRFVYW